MSGTIMRVLGKKELESWLSSIMKERTLVAPKHVDDRGNDTVMSLLRKQESSQLNEGVPVSGERLMQASFYCAL